MAKSALDSALPFLNGERKVRLGLEHIRTFPPFGVMMNGEVFQGDDKEYYLAADRAYFDKREFIVLEDGTKLFREYFSEGSYPFIECRDGEVGKMEISTDSANYESPEEVFEINKIVSEESGTDFEGRLIGRKSALPDPETIITITKIVAVALGIAKSKVVDKVGEVVGDDLAKFYKMLSRLAIETIKRAKPENRPKNFVVLYPNSDCIIELVIATCKVDEVLNALVKDKLEIVKGKLEQLKNLNPEKVQFIYKEDKWEFNYLLSVDGSVTGILQAFNDRNLMYNKILENQEKRSEESS